MKKAIISLLIILAGVFTLNFAPAAPAFAADGGDNHGCGVDTAIIDCSNDPEKDGIKHVLGLVIDIMTIGVGILGVIGISIVGIQYLTAGGSEDKTRKAKQRLLEIVIGLAIYAVFYAVLTFLNVK